MQNAAPTELPSPPEAAARPAVAIPLTTKAILACMALVIYGALMAAYVLSERHAMLSELAALDERAAFEEALKRAALSTSNALLSLRESPGDEALDAAAREVTPFALEAVDRDLASWRAELPALFGQHELARRRLAAVLAQPSRASFLELRQAVAALGREIERDAAREIGLRIGMQRGFRDHGDRAILTALALGLAGLVAFGGAATLFFARLASDLRALGERSLAIVSGYRGEPLEVTRRDEVGLLMRDVNHLASDLAARERELALARERRAHREKMATLGAIARTLSHEIGNPLATVSAVVQNAAAAADERANALWQPRLLLEQTQRIAGITRQIAEFSGPGTGGPEPVDAVAMLRTVCDLMQFDSRYRAIRIELEVAPGLPAIVAVPDQLSELFMNLLQPGGEPSVGPPGRIEVRAELRDAQLAIVVTGVPADGDGVRLLRSRQLAEGMGGQLLQRGEAVEVRLPVARGAWEAA